MAGRLKLPARNGDGDAHVVVETPRGSAAKLEYDPELQALTLSKALILGLTYPYDWGFIPSTKGEDGDPIDVLVLHDAATAPGLVLKCKIIGVLEVLQSEKGKKPIRNDRLIGVPRHSHREKSDKDYPSKSARKSKNSSWRRNGGVEWGATSSSACLEVWLRLRLQHMRRTRRRWGRLKLRSRLRRKSRWRA